MISLFIFLIALIACDQSIIKLSTPAKDIFNYSISFNKESYDISDYDTSGVLTVTGKLCNQTNLELLYSECIFKYENYNREWVNFYNIDSIIRQY
jgi:hypothetical protein